MKMPVGTKVEMQVGRFVISWHYRYDQTSQRKEWDWIVPPSMYETDEMDTLETAIAFTTDNVNSIASGDYPFKIEAAINMIESDKERTRDCDAYY